MARKPPNENPVVKKFGRELSRLRNLSGMSQAQLADKVGFSGAQIGHIERAERTPSKWFAEKVDELLEAGGRLKELWKDIQRTSYPEYAGSYFEALANASMLREYQPMLVPGLLQTEDYTRAFVYASNPTATEEYVARVVAARTRSQELLTASDRPVVWVIITELVINSLLSTPSILLGQVDRLLALMEPGRIRLQVAPAMVPFDQHPGMDGPFTILSLPERQEVAYIEGAASGSIVTKPESVDRLSLKFGSLQGIALSPMQTVDYLKEVRGEVDGNQDVAHLQLHQRRGWSLRGGSGDSPGGTPA